MIERITIDRFSAPVHLSIDMLGRYEADSGNRFIAMVNETILQIQGIAPSVYDVRGFLYHLLGEHNEDLPAIEDIKWRFNEINVAWAAVCATATDEVAAEVDDADPLASARSSGQSTSSR